MVALACDDGQIKLLKESSLELDTCFFFDDVACTSLSFTGTGNLLAGYANGSLAVYDTSSKKQIKQLKVADESINQILVHDNSAYCLVCGQIFTVDLEKDTIENQITEKAIAAVSLGREHLALVVADGTEAQVFSLAQH